MHEDSNPNCHQLYMGSEVRVWLMVSHQCDDNATPTAQQVHCDAITRWVSISRLSHLHLHAFANNCHFINNIMTNY